MDIFGDEWRSAAVSALAELPTLDGVDADIDYVIEGSPSGRVIVAVTVEGGTVTAISPGKSTDPDVVVAMKYGTALEILTGELSSEVGFMNGAVKVEGAHGRWMLDLRPLRVAAIEALAPVMAATTI